MAKTAKQIANDDDFYSLLGPDPESTRHKPPVSVSESDLAVFWGVSTRQVRQLVTEQIIQRANKEFELCPSTQKYIRHLIGLANQRGKTDPRLAAEKLRLAREQADKLEIANAAKRGELVSSVSVEREWVSILHDLRVALLALPSRVGARLPTLSAFELQQFDNEIRQVLNELATTSSTGESQS